MDDFYSRSASNNAFHDFDWSSPLGISILTFIIILEIAIIFGNFLVVLAVVYTAKLRTILNMYIISLAIADLLIGTITVPINLYELFKELETEDLWSSIDVWTQTASIWSLVAISADRYVAVTRPIIYHKITPKIALLFIACVWIISFFICLPTLLGWLEIIDQQTYEESVVLLLYSVFGTFYVPFTLMLIFYWRIYKIAVSTTNAINQGYLTTKGLQSCSSRCDGEVVELRIHRGQCRNDDINAANRSQGSGRKREFSAKKATKARRTVSIILGVFMLTCSPLFIMFPVQRFFPNSINHIGALIVSWLTFCNSALNPVIYALSNRDYRFGIRRILCNCCCQRIEQLSQHSSNNNRMQ